MMPQTMANRLRELPGGLAVAEFCTIAQWLADDLARPPGSSRSRFAVANALLSDRARGFSDVGWKQRE
jgi:hypothetical protein